MENYNLIFKPVGSFNNFLMNGIVHLQKLLYVSHLLNLLWWSYSETELLQMYLIKRWPYILEWNLNPIWLVTIGKKMERHTGRQFVRTEEGYSCQLRIQKAWQLPPRSKRQGRILPCNFQMEADYWYYLFKIADFKFLTQ